MPITRPKEKEPIKINWEVLPDKPNAFFLLNNQAFKELEKIKRYLNRPDQPTSYEILHIVIQKLSTTSMYFDIVVGYLLKRLGVPVFISINPHLGIESRYLEPTKKIINNTLDTIDLLGIRKTEILLRSYKINDVQPSKTL